MSILLLHQAGCLASRLTVNKTIIITREGSVEVLFRPIVKSSESHALGICSWNNKIVMDVGMTESLLKKKLHVQKTNLQSEQS